jgi:hypothetical protein
VRHEPQKKGSTRLSKRTILYLSLGSIVLIILGVIFAVVAATGITTDATGAATGASASTGIFGILALACYGIGAILAVIAWIGGLIKTATISAWGWFVVVLILGSLGALIYALAGPETRATPAY